MGPMTDGAPHDDRAVAAFYDRLAAEYDAMTLPEERFARELPLFRTLVERHGIRTAVDAGSGAGFHALMLARSGVQVTAVDISPEMLLRLAENAGRLGLVVRSMKGSLRELPALLPDTSDALFCMGNTLPHLLTPSELAETLHGFARVIRPGGLLMIQILNYDRIMARRERVQHVREEGNITFVRFYDYEDPLIRFNILRLERTAGGIRHRLSSVILRPILSAGLREVLQQSGFTSVETFGDITTHPFDPAASADLVVLARRADPPAVEIPGRFP